MALWQTWRMRWIEVPEIRVRFPREPPWGGSLIG
jgi:hypothetical protein